MDNFIFRNPTQIYFGKGMENKAGEAVSVYSKNILLHYGGGSIKKSGLYDRVIASLKSSGVEWTELAGVKPNPRLSLVREGIKICREKDIDFILAVGGGSVIDSAKAIAAGVPYEGDVWDFYEGKAQPEEVIGLGTVLTIPAAGSESSNGTVITKEEGQLKRPCGSELLYPDFSILNPELAMTLPPFQRACGVADMMAHLFERYFTNSYPVELTDRMIEAVLKTIIHNGPSVMMDGDTYDAWAEIMWSGTVAHNGSLDTGRLGDWGSHQMEHELSGIYDVAHGAGLAALFPHWMRYVMNQDIKRFVQLAVRVWNVDQNFKSDEETALAGIEALEQFWQSLGLATTLSGLDIPGDRLEEMAGKCAGETDNPQGQFVKLYKKDVLAILEMAL
ncbi:iron-containing alcohol dehydrogenase [Oceanispirochaeta sp.]|jgi:alcohol dehydrogenase YqhD (iron-dependent ADH family)|uniref:iron-containing alcohol dehydrogenase n=1 Tax=Oceanispirochaeta sp. TaxID=2035350 RepID=UPI002609C932|nr:iron-containing alcohol dehydrogenase [Oceanispirochaeta sp.]MDA3957605.1 iron-containing alcohol dehydrogenase [Oceanispirochaeta sp.]